MARTLRSPATALTASHNMPRWPLPVALLLGVLPYLNSLNAFWVGDDYNYVVPKTLQTVIKFFDPYGRAVYRPLNWLSWAVDYALFGNEPLGWKLTSLAMHLVTVALIFVLLRELLAVWTEQGVALALRPLAGWLPLLGAALFAVQPSHPETVTWTGGRADVSTAPWVFLAAWAFVRWRRGAGNGWYALAVVGVVGALLSKEVGLVAAVALVLIDLVALKADLRREKWLSLLLVHAPWIALNLLYVLMRLYLFSSGQGRLAYGLDTHLQFGGALIDSAVGYLLLGLGWWGAPDTVHGWALAIRLGILLAALALAALAWWRLGRPALFAILWIPLMVAVTYDAATPRWFYIASFGVCLLVALALVSAQAESARRAAIGLAALLIVGWGLITAEYNSRWQASGEVARGLIDEIRTLHPDPALPATFYMGNAPYSYNGALLFNSGFAIAPAYAYQDYVNVHGYELSEHAAQVQAALADPTKIGPNPIFLRYENGHMVNYPSLPALVAADAQK